MTTCWLLCININASSLLASILVLLLLFFTLMQALILVSQYDWLHLHFFFYYVRACSLILGV